jgi:chromosome segregation ATPase
VLSLFSFIVGSAFVVLIGAGTAWVLLRKAGLMRRKRDFTWLNLQGELPAILNEFQSAIDTAQADAEKGTKIGEAVMAAVKAIDLALRDYQKRIADLETRMEGSEKQSAELAQSLTSRQASLDQNSKALAGLEVRLDGVAKLLTALTEQFADFKQATESGIDTRFDGVGKQLTAVNDQLAGLRQASESGASQHKAAGEALRVISGSLAALKSQVAGLAQRLDVEETGQARLSALAEATSASVAALTATSEKNAQEIVALEPRLLWKIESLETLVNSTQASIRPLTGDDEADDSGEFVRRDGNDKRGPDGGESDPIAPEHALAPSPPSRSR